MGRRTCCRDIVRNPGNSVQLSLPCAVLCCVPRCAALRCAVLCCAVLCCAAGEMSEEELQTASQRGDAPEVRRLLAAGAAVDAADGAGQTPLHYVAASGHSEAATALLSAGAAVDAADTDGLTPLHWAAYYRQSGVLRLLLRSGADVSAVTTKQYWVLPPGSTPLDCAIHENCAAAVAALAACGGTASRPVPSNWQPLIDVSGAVLCVCVATGGVRCV